MFSALAARCARAAIVDVNGLVLELSTAGSPATLAGYVLDYLPVPRLCAGEPVFAIQLCADGDALDRITRIIRAIPGNDVTPFRDVVYRAHACDAVTWFDVVRDDKDGLVGRYVIGWNGRHALVVVHPGVARPERLAVRVARELIMRWHENRHAIVFHAAGVARRDRGLLIAGHSGAGKTTSLLLAADRGGTLLSNDRMIVSPVPGRWTLVGVPLPVRIGRATIEGIPKLRRFLGGAELARPQLLGQDPALLPIEFASSKKIELTPRELATVLGGSLACAAPLHAIVLPELGQDERSAWCERASVEHARAVLEASCFTPEDETWLSPWLLPRRASRALLAETARATCEALAASVPAYRVGLGVQARAAGRLRSLRGLLRALFGGRGPHEVAV